MRLFSLLLGLTFLLMQTVTYAEEAGLSPAQTPTPAEPEKNQVGYLMFQVIKDQFVFDNTTIKNASLVMDGQKYVGLKVTLKPLAAKEFEKITTTGIGKPATLIFDKTVISTTLIQSTLGGTVLVSGLTMQQAQQFLILLTQIEKRHVAEKRVAHMPGF